MRIAEAIGSTLTRRVVCPPRHSPFDWDGGLTFLARRAVAGIEHVEAGAYRRTIRCDDQSGTLDVSSDDESGGLVVTVHGLRDQVLDATIERVRRMFDLDADLPAIRAHLSRDSAIKTLVAAIPAFGCFAAGILSKSQCEP